MLRPVAIEASEKYIVSRFRRLRTEDVEAKGQAAEWSTIADKESSNHILAYCRPRLPGSFSEEDINDERFSYDTVWEVDPLDGTLEFRLGTEGFAMQAALLHRSNHLYVPVAGMIYLPPSRKMYYGTLEHGPFFEIDGVESKLGNPIRDRIVVANRGADPWPQIEAFSRYCGDIGVVNAGGAGHTIGALLEGRINTYIVPIRISSEWDFSMAEPMVSRLGGRITDKDGNNLTYNRRDTKNRNGVVVSVGVDHTDVLERIRAFERAGHTLLV